MITDHEKPNPWNGYSGLCDFTDVNGMHERVVWRIRRTHRRSRRGIKRGHIIFLEIRVNDHTTVVWEEGAWYHWWHTLTDKTTKEFYNMLIRLYN